MKTRTTLLKHIVVVVATLLLSQADLWARETFTLNRDWKFFTYSENYSSIVNLPHQWNSDALSGRLDYYRGVGNYLRYVDFRPEWKEQHKRIYIRFGGRLCCSGR